MDSVDPGTGLDHYTALAAAQRSELEIRKSRFITVLHRIDSEEAARSAVTELRHRFPDARHHCSAFILGAGRSVQRSHDDGEPAGTAGAPMLEALIRQETTAGAADLSDVCAVVVRYFGGTLLGAGGLIRAYSESVSTALASATLVRRHRMQLYGIELAHAEAGRLEHELRAEGVRIVSNDYGAGSMRLTVALPAGGIAGAFPGRLAALTAGRSSAEPRGSLWMDLD